MLHVIPESERGDFEVPGNKKSFLMSSQDVVDRRAENK